MPIFCVIGGSGSQFLRRALRRRFTLFDKPDTLFRDRLTRFMVEKRVIKQGNLRKKTQGLLEELPDCPYSALRLLLDMHQQNAGLAIILNTFPEMGLLSRYSVRGTFFFVRHPLHAYLSWTKPERHGAVIDSLGGSAADDAIEFYSSRWNAMVDELIRLRDRELLGAIIRYEFAKEDWSATRLDPQILDEFDSGRRNWALCTDQINEEVHRRVAANFYEIYDAWEI